jgi:hypothetical protein
VAVEQIAAAHAQRQVTLARRVAQELAKLWQLVDPGNIAGSWRDLLPSALVAVSTGQAVAAASAGMYVSDVTAEYKAGARVEGRVVPAAFAGTASDGRDLAGLLYQPAVVSLRQIGQGASPGGALSSGRFVLDMIGRTQIADAGRAADGVAITTRPQLTGYVRMVVGKTCSRCLILAGRTYRWNAGFKRHPRCDCRHIPIAEDVPGDVRTDPDAYFKALDVAEQDKLLGRAGAEAVRAGADLAQVVNARKGMQAASVFGRDVLVTTSGTTVRGLAGQRLGARQTETKAKQDRYRRAVRVRLMPEQIYRESGGSRDEAVRLLRLHGYII